MPSPILTSDVNTMLADKAFTHVLTFGAQTARGWLDWEEIAENDSSGYSVFVRRRKFGIATAAFNPFPVAKDTIVATDDGNPSAAPVTYTVHDARKSFDGLLTDLYVVTP